MAQEHGMDVPYEAEPGSIASMLINSRRVTFQVENSLISENQQLKSQIELLRKELDGRENCCDPIKLKASKLEAKVKGLEAEVYDLQKRIEKLEAEAEALRPENSGYESDDERSSSSMTLRERSTSPRQTPVPSPFRSASPDNSPIYQPQSPDNPSWHADENDSGSAARIDFRDIYEEQSDASPYVPESPYRSLSSPYPPSCPPQSSIHAPEIPFCTPDSPAYNPTSPVLAPESPFDTPDSPAYNPTSPVLSPESPFDTPDSPAYNPTSPVLAPESPFDTPDSPAYNPTSPVLHNGLTLAEVLHSEYPSDPEYLSDLEYPSDSEDPKKGKNGRAKKKDTGKDSQVQVSPLAAYEVQPDFFRYQDVHAAPLLRNPYHLSGQDMSSYHDNSSYHPDLSSLPYSPPSTSVRPACSLPGLNEVIPATSQFTPRYENNVPSYISGDMSGAERPLRSRSSVTGGTFPGLSPYAASRSEEYDTGYNDTQAHVEDRTRVEDGTGIFDRLTRMGSSSFHFNGAGTKRKFDGGAGYGYSGFGDSNSGEGRGYSRGEGEEREGEDEDGGSETVRESKRRTPFRRNK